MKVGFSKWAVYVLILPVLLACAPQQIEDVGIASISREEDQVLVGRSLESLSQLSGTDWLYNGDFLRILNGGEAVLDFGDNLRLRLFNLTELGRIISTSAPGTPLNARMTLERGGLTGELVEAGGEAVFETPGGAEIRVLGTQFLIVYNADFGVTTVANFDGTVIVTTAGVTLLLEQGNFVQVPFSEPDGPQKNIPFSPAVFEERARELGSPVAALDQLLSQVPVTGPEQPSPTPEVVDETTPTLANTDTPIPTKTRTPTKVPTSTSLPTPTMTPVLCPPKMVVEVNAFCRQGPGQVYDTITGFLPGQELQVEGRNNGNTWWWVLIPDTRAHCWISDATVRMDGEASCLQVIVPPPTPTPSPTPTLTPTPTPTTCPELALGTPCP